MDSGHNRLEITTAGPADIEALVHINSNAAARVHNAGYDPGSPPRPMRQILAERVAGKQVSIARIAGDAAGTITLATEDDGVWRDLPADNALYVHGLAVLHEYAGRGVGRAMLTWAEDVARQRGCVVLRLDCNADNPRLRRYYSEVGFTHRGDVDLGYRTASRFERVVSGTAAR